LQVETSLRALKIPFVLLKGQPRDTIPAYAAQQELGTVVTDYSPMRISKTWKVTDTRIVRH
jgi:deoxyribodipyrimidine photo-lyase